MNIKGKLINSRVSQDKQLEDHIKEIPAKPPNPEESLIQPSRNSTLTKSAYEDKKGLEKVLVNHLR